MFGSRQGKILTSFQLMSDARDDHIAMGFHWQRVIRGILGRVEQGSPAYPFFWATGRSSESSKGASGRRSVFIPRPVYPRLESILPQPRVRITDGMNPFQGKRPSRLTPARFRRVTSRSHTNLRLALIETHQVRVLRDRRLCRLGYLFRFSFTRLRPDLD